MNRFRRILGTVGVALIALLMGLSILGAFLGPDRARAMFTSPPIAAMWTLLIVVLLAGCLAWPIMLRRPSLLAMHVGGVLIVAGAMWGSRPAEDLRRALTGRSPMADGAMQVAIGSATAEAVTLGTDRQAPSLRALPFAVHCRDAWKEYYPTDVDRWMLYVRREVDGRERITPLGLAFESPQALPDTDISVRVLRYVAPAPDDPPAMLLDSPELTAVVPLRIGTAVDIPRAGATLTALRFLRSAQVLSEGDKQTYVDRPGGLPMPGVEVEFRAEGRPEPIRMLVRSPQAALERWKPSQNLLLMYLPPARPGTNRTPAPVVKLEFHTPSGNPVAGWIAAGRKPVSRVSLRGLFQAQEAFDAIGQPELLLVAPAQALRDVKADLALLDDNGQALRQKTIEVNKPLRYGGYSMYLQRLEYPFVYLRVRRHGHWYVVYAGFGLLLAGGIGALWLSPLLRRSRRMQADTGDES